MAYVQKPGRGNSAKTGNGLPSVFKSSPMHQENFKTWYEAKDIAKSRKGFNKLSELEQGIELAATNDSLVASRPKNPEFSTLKEKQTMGHNAANKTRQVNNSNYTVEKKDELISPTKGYKTVYNKVKVKK
jgi:hypothetical protein